MGQIYVIRHCSAFGQAADAPLTPEGRRQAQVLADFLMDSGIEMIVCSPYLRARQSIEPWAERTGIPVRIDARLQERALSDVSMDDWLASLERTFEDFDLTFSGGEPSRAAMRRAVAAVDEVLASGARCVGIVTHGNLMTLLLRHFDGRFGFAEWADLSNPDVFVVTVDGEAATVERVWG